MLQLTHRKTIHASLTIMTPHQLSHNVHTQIHIPSVTTNISPLLFTSERVDGINNKWNTSFPETTRPIHGQHETSKVITIRPEVGREPCCYGDTARNGHQTVLIRVENLLNSRLLTSQNLESIKNSIKIQFNSIQCFYSRHLVHTLQKKTYQITSYKIKY